MYGRPQQKKASLIDDDDDDDDDNDEIEKDEDEFCREKLQHMTIPPPVVSPQHHYKDDDEDPPLPTITAPSSIIQSDPEERTKLPPGSGSSTQLWGRKTEKSKGLEDDDVLDDRQIAFAEDTALLRNNEEDDEELKAALKESQRHQEEKVQLKSLSGKEIEEVMENARTLRSLLTGENSLDFLQTLLGMCKEDQKRVTQAIEETMRAETIDTQDLEVLFDLNSNILDAIQKGEQMLGVPGSQPASRPTHEAASMEGEQKPKSKQKKVNLDVHNLVVNKDIFSLICMLRVHHNEKRWDAAVALMQFARDAEKGDPEFIRIREEIRSSGGMHSFLTLFRTRNSSYELKIVTALAVAYVLPSFVESGSQSSPSLCLKIVECLRFLVSAGDSTRFTHEELFDAAAKALTTFWVSHIEPSLQSEKVKMAVSSDSMNEGLRRHSSWGRQRGRYVDQREQSLASTELLESTVSLILRVTKDESEGHVSCKYSHNLIEQVCAVESARPIAVRRGILQVLVAWIRSGDRDKIRPAVSALRYVTSVTDKYMAGWIHSEMVNKGAVEGLIQLTHDISTSPDIRLAIAQIISSLCAAPHTRAAVVEAKCVKFLISLLYEYNDRLSKDVAYYAGNAILQLASGAMAKAPWAANGEVQVPEYISHDERDSMVGYVVHYQSFCLISRLLLVEKL